MRRAWIAIVLTLAPLQVRADESDCVWRNHEPRCCDVEWCGRTGAIAGEERCRLDVYSMCSACPGWGCGAAGGGCDPDFCAAAAQRVDDYRCDLVYPGACGNCNLDAAPPCSRSRDDMHDEQAPACAPDTARVMIILDASSSMSLIVDGRTRLEWAKSAILNLRDTCGRVALGLAAFPTRAHADGCDAGRVRSTVGEGRRSFVQQLDRISAYGSSPIAATINTVMNGVPSSSVGRVVLLTDGAETCDGDPLAAVSALFLRGIQTVVVGFDALSNEDRESLDEMAIRGGAPRRDRSRSSDPYYYEAADGEALAQLLSSDVCEVLQRTEICDGADNDCDGEVDEANDLTFDPPPFACLDACDQPIDYVCETGAWVCLPPALPGLGESCIAGVGACAREGSVTCHGCSAVVGESTNEVCNTVDDDCDGETDERAPLMCSPPECGGAETTTDPCDPVCGETPNCTEHCDGLDNDFDGQTDDASWVGRCCRFVKDQQVLQGTLHCGADAKGRRAPVCITPSGQRQTISANFDVDSDWCDGVDNDCDGEADEDLANSTFEDRACYLEGDDTSLEFPFGARGERVCWTRCDGQRLEVCARGGTDMVCAPCGTEPAVHFCEPESCKAEYPACGIDFLAEHMCAPQCDGTFLRGWWWAGNWIRQLSCHWCGEGSVDSARSYNYACDTFCDGGTP